jgi:hypothetical protein
MIEESPSKDMSINHYMRAGLNEDLIRDLYERSQALEQNYVNETTKVFKTVRRQQEMLECGLEEMKTRFLESIQKDDGMGEKLTQFIYSFNRFTEEFPELRPDKQTQEELMNRLQIFNDDCFSKHIEQTKNENIQERQFIMSSGWIEHEM